jgi:CRISPR-associated protein Cas2
MTVILLTNVKASVRGELTRWMLEPRAGVFVGKVSSLVRDRLWAKVQRSAGSDSSGLLLYAADTEQGYRLEAFGSGSRRVRDFDGLLLIARVREGPET